ncbi:alpha/beta hydrolase family protein [Gemmatimonadota bacterium]
MPTEQIYRPAYHANQLIRGTLKPLCILITLALFGIITQPLLAQNRQQSGDRHERSIQEKARRDAKFQELYEGVLDMKKTVYLSRIGEFEVPVYIFQPLELRGDAGHAALIWVHGGVHGDLDPEHYAPFIREAVIDRGYVVIAPEYRGSTGYGQEHYDAIDYGGWEVDDVLTAVDYIKAKLPHVDPERLGMIGWSHGGFITLHSIFREQHTFQCAAAMVPVTNLTFRLSYKGPRYASSYTIQPRIGGLPHEPGPREVYIERSPVYHVDKLEIPLIVHVAENDRDVNFVECEMMVHALEYKKPHLAETKIYENPPGGHSFNRMVDQQNGYERQYSWEQRDSWNRIWTFLELHLKPYLDAEGNIRYQE